MTFFRHAAPGTQVDFVNGHGRIQGLSPRTPAEPILVVPVGVTNLANDGSGLRAHFRAESERVCLQGQDLTPAGYNLILVDFAFPDARKKDFPNACRASDAHRMAAPVPSVQVAHHAHTPRIGSPDGKRYAAHPLNLLEMGAQLVVSPVMRAFAQKVKIKIRK